MANDNDDIWQEDNIEINEDGEVEGSAYTHHFKDGHDVQIGVFSYTYQRNGETHMNHVPSVVVTDSTGSIVAEPHAHDTENPRGAIRNARQSAEYVYKHPEEFIE